MLRRANILQSNFFSGDDDPSSHKLFPAHVEFSRLPKDLLYVESTGKRVLKKIPQASSRKIKQGLGDPKKKQGAKWATNSMKEQR